MKKGWKVLREEFHDHTKNVRGSVTKTPIAYLMHDRLIPLPEDDDNKYEYADFDQQLIARHPIIQAVHAAVAKETVEKSGPRKKRPQVNGDNTFLFHLSKSVFGKTSWWTHARPAENNKAGRLAIRLLSQNLEGGNAMDEINAKNKSDILRLCYDGETRAWGVVKYINAHKTHQNFQAQLHDDHGFNDFEDWEKVTILTNGIKTGEYDAAVLSINADTAGAPNSFEKAQLRLLEFKSLIDERKRNQHNVPSVEGCGRGSGGRGRGRGGPGRGEGCGDSLDPLCADTTNRSKHVTTAGGQALRVAKLPNGDWDTVQISRGTHDHLAKKQVNINKTWYPSSAYGEMEPLERRMLFINQYVEKGHRKGGGRPVSSVAAVSVA